MITTSNQHPSSTYTRIKKKYFEINRRGYLEIFSSTKAEYYGNSGDFVGKVVKDGSTSNSSTKDAIGGHVIEGVQVVASLENRPIIEDGAVKMKYPATSEESQQQQENFGWKWISPKWVHEGADSWWYGGSSSCKKPANVISDSKWSKTQELLSTTRRRIHYRYAIKKNVSDAELEWLKKNHYEIVKSPEAQFHNDMTKLKSQLHEEYENVQAKTEKPNILLLGGSGAGKSSLINAVFGKSLAEIGNGLPVTQTYKKFEDPDIEVVIYDSKGIEHGSIEEGFLEDTKRFFMTLRQNNDMINHIHVVWYVIDLTQARFQPFEAQFCREHLKDIPIIFVFNKADAVAKQTLDTMISVVKDQLPNCHGFFPTVAQCKNFDRKDCPMCGSLRIRKRVKEGTCTILCKDCQEKSEMHQTEGIQELSRATLSVLPNFVQEVFVNAQKSNMIFQQESAKAIIKSYAINASLSKQLKNSLRRMACELVQRVYKLPLLTHLAEDTVEKRYKSYFLDAGLLRRLEVKWTDLWNGQSAPALVIASGLEICRNCIEFKKEIARRSLQEDNADEELISYEVLAQIHFSVDKKMIRRIVHELQEINVSTEEEAVERYMNQITVDANPDSFYPSLRKKKVVEEEKVDIVLHAYQKRKPKQVMASAGEPEKAAVAPVPQEGAKKQITPQNGTVTVPEESETKNPVTEATA
mmetsp:Transcript_11403/g.42817  ORF Transcript_11403/g.42817 Transcript_11403/m.42817 type:complete len:694 (-) Transcript_11403:78-2159(-)|eukprot:CAMPEP_0117447508 /NCGR_PEP_ID=MMETSP0759-20121206/6914_1 /TAXON_ID=63605 /ORGANISM="Percolomonas cosmopolitus, Strain WS" /LENGTH=693 /DNA_ID=CAMNT_0005239851 /DNA_START=286 /DNA_END=2367 /DNA_ORIENTATION=+